MGLLTKLNETSLRSLRYGKDRIGGGSSNQPYITKSIPDNDSSLGNTGGPDFLLRGGTLAVTKTADDVSRLTKMFFDTKSFNGFGFIAKQNLLSRTGVKTQAGGQEIYLPTSTLAQAGVEAFGLHFYKQGLNPIPIPSNGPIISLGLLGAISPTGNIISYSQVVKVGSNSSAQLQRDSNRLVQLTNNKILGKTTIGNNITNPIDNVNILRYGGGPGSILGIGPTNIKFADQRTATLLKTKNTDNYTLLNVSQIRLLSEDNSSRGNKSYTPSVIDFRNELRKGLVDNSSTILSKSPSYYLGDNLTIENRVFLGNPGTAAKNIYSYTSGSGLGPLDKITAKPLYLSSLVDDKEVNDLVKFRIEAINNNNPGESVFIHFRAFLDSFSDVYNATWNPTKYIGRGEDFYTYGGFTRGISINWTVAAQSKEELIPMHQKLNYLASNLTPDYSNNGYMRGPMMRLTVGGYLYSQPGFITNLTYTIDENSPWEIGIDDTNAESDNSVKELPHVIRVNMNYTPIHNFVPRKQTNTYNGEPAGDGKFISAFGPEHYIALSTGESHNNYNKSPNYTRPRS